MAVFQSPIEPDQAYVKRVVGLPGEAVQIVDGDVWVDGRIARKTIAEAKGARVPVFDNRFQPLDAPRFPRWHLGGPRALRFTATGWQASGSGFVHEPTASSDTGVDWLEYRHWDPDLGRYGPIQDSYPYNGGDRRAGHVVRDVMVDASISVRADVDAVQVRIVHGSDRFILTLPVDAKGPVELFRSGKRMPVVAGPASLRSSPAASPQWDLLEVATIDHRLSATLGGKRLIEPVDYETAGPSYLSTASPVALGVVNGSIAVRDPRIYRDVYYTGELAAGSRRPAAVAEPLPLGRGNTSSWETTARSRTTRGSGTAGRSSAATSSSASRSWSICRGRSTASGSSDTSWGGFPTSARYVTFISFGPEPITRQARRIIPRTRPLTRRGRPPARTTAR